MWRRMNGQTFGSGRRKGSQRRKPEVCASEGLQAPCRRTFMKSTSYGNPGKLLERQRRNYAVCHCLHSVTGQKFTKKPSYCKRAFLQKCVRSCKCPLQFYPFHNTTKTHGFPLKIHIFKPIFLSGQNVHNLAKELVYASLVPILPPSKETIFSLRQVPDGYLQTLWRYL